jgi:hypothetical protein
MVPGYRLLSDMKNREVWQKNHKIVQIQALRIRSEKARIEIHKNSYLSTLPQGYDLLS